MRALVFEADHAGHRLQYVRVLIQALQPLCKEVVFFTGENTVSSVEYRIHLQELEPFFRVVTQQYVSREAPFCSALARLQAFQVALRNLKADHVFVPYADGLAQLLGPAKIVDISKVPTDVEIEGIMMRGGFAYPSERVSDRLKGMASLIAIRLLPFQVLHQLDPIPFSALKRRGGKLSALCRIIPEPVEPIAPIETAEARRKIGIPSGGRYLVNIGAGDIRKGTHLLVRAFAQTKLGADYRLLLMGKLDPVIRRLIETEMRALLQDGRLIVIDQYLSQDQFCLGLNAADVICTPYPRHIGSSGIIVRAAAMGKPILASDYGWVGAAVSTFGLGRTCSVSDLEGFSLQISECLENAPGYRQTDHGARFVRFHTISNFKAHITARLRSRMGLSSLGDGVSWEAVLNGMKDISPLLA